MVPVATLQASAEWQWSCFLSKTRWVYELERGGPGKEGEVGGWMFSRCFFMLGIMAFIEVIAKFFFLPSCFIRVLVHSIYSVYL